MMSDDDDIDLMSADQSAKNLASLFHSGEAAPIAAPIPLKQPKKDSSPKVMIATTAQAFLFSTDQKWAPRGKMGVAIISTENTMFQLILYLTKTQHVTSARIAATSIFKCQPNNYLSFQDDGGQNWSLMFDNKQALVDFVLQMVIAKAYLLSFKFDHIFQDIREGDGLVLSDHDSVEITINQYKFNESGTVTPIDTGEIKPTRLKIGKQQFGKTLDDVLRGMKKNGQRIIMIGTTIYNIEVTRIKREKETRTGSITMPIEVQPIIEPKRVNTDDIENTMLQRIHKMGGVSMLPNSNQGSAFVAPLPSHISSLNDDDSVNNELLQHVTPISTITQPSAVQYVPPMFHHPHQPVLQNFTQQPNLYSPQSFLHDYNSRPGSSMGTIPYPQGSMWSHSAHPHNTHNVPSMDTLHQQQAAQNDFRQQLYRLTEKIDLLNEKYDAKNSTSYPNMETSILLANIQRIVKENDNMKKDLFDRSAKIEELNLKISDLLDKNQKLIEQTHQTAAQRNDAVQDVSGQTAQRILDLEKQKVELTNNLGISTSKIAELQLQLNKYAQDTNENQSRVNTLIHQCEQNREDAEKSESRRLEIQSKLDSIQEQLKNEKSLRKQLQANCTTLEEELAEARATCSSLEKLNNERKTKFDNERKRYQDDLDEQKQIYEKELDELRMKLRKQRTADNLTNSQEITRIEQDLERQWQDKFDRQQTQYERLLASKVKEIDQFKALLTENDDKLKEVNEERQEAQKQIEVYEEQCKKLQDRLSFMKEKLIEMNEEQSETLNNQVKRTISLVFQRLKARIPPTKQYTGEQYLSRTLDIIKKATLKVLSSDDGDYVESEQSADEIDSADETEQTETNNGNHATDQPVNGSSIDQQTLNEEISSIPKSLNAEIIANESEKNTITSNNSKNGWDTVDDFQGESKIQSDTLECSQLVFETEDTTCIGTENDMISSNAMSEANEAESLVDDINKDHHKESINKVDENEDKELASDVELSKELAEDDNDDIDDQSTSDRAFVSSSVSATNVVSIGAPSKYVFNQNIPLVTNPDDSDDEIFR